MTSGTTALDSDKEGHADIGDMTKRLAQGNVEADISCLPKDPEKGEKGERGVSSQLLLLDPTPSRETDKKSQV